MPIRTLPPEVAAKIAAGEVVERPASVVKELVENALDAVAGQIEVELRGGGLASIRVTDDGSGILADELELALRRHSTSKIASADDLWRIETLGFRGEALAAIAAVAAVTLVSRTAEAPAGSYVVADPGGQAVERGQQGAPLGTTVLVRDLFAAVPARLAFLRSRAAEGTRCLEVVSRYALAYPEVAFRLLLDGRLAFHSAGNGDHRDVLAGIWGPETASALHPLEETRVGATAVRGLAGPPELQRARRDGQVTFVNRRWVESRILSYAIADAYRDLVPRGRHPVVILFVQVPPAEVDVNVHPAKAEVRFRREGEVFAAVQRALRQTMAAHSLLPLGDSVVPRPANSVPPAPPDSEVALTAPPLFPDVRPQERDPRAAAPGEALTLLRPVGQVGTTYIVAEGPDGMYLVDQHAAHERLVFDRVLAASREEGEEPTQALLDPASISLTRLQAEALGGMADLLAAYGFRWEPFGEGAILLRGIPRTLRVEEAARALLEALDESGGRGVLAEQGEGDPLGERARRLAATVACHSAVRAGQVLSFAEMDGLLRAFEAARFPRLCPHGRPTMVHLSTGQLERQFGRR